ncbi:hypothetical protein FG147_07680 [Thauera sp. UPWRP]|nr:hypothetical protein FG147_07680 [Thauera sp. UPWRP]
MSKFDKLLRRLREMTTGANTACRDFTALLIEFGFEVRDGSKGGHKVVTHPALPLAEAKNYNCGHNPGTMVKKPYVKEMLKFVQHQEDALREWIGHV